MPTVTASPVAPQVVSTQSDGGWLKAAYDQELEARQVQPQGWKPREVTTGFLSGGAAETGSYEEEPTEFEVPMSPGAKELESAGTLQGRAAIKVRSRKPPFFKFKNGTRTRTQISDRTQTRAQTRDPNPSTIVHLQPSLTALSCTFRPSLLQPQAGRRDARDFRL